MKTIAIFNSTERFKSSPRHHSNKFLSSFIYLYTLISHRLTSLFGSFVRPVTSIRADKGIPKSNANATQLQRKISILSIFFLLLLPSVSIACDRGFVLFAGYGYDYGAHDYQKDQDLNGEKYRDNSQGVFGMEYNARHWRAQFFHSSSLDNKEKSSFGDVNMLTVQFKWRPKTL